MILKNFALGAALAVAAFGASGCMSDGNRYEPDDRRSGVIERGRSDQGDQRNNRDYSRNP